MSPIELSSSTAKALALHTLQSIHFVALASHGPEGWPDVREMACATPDGLETISFITPIDARKNVQITANSKSVVFGFDPETMAEVRLFGHAELLGDTATKLSVWQEDFDRFFPEGVYAPHLLVIRLQTKYGEYASPTDGTGSFSFD